MSTEVYISCENCDEQQAQMTGGHGTEKNPWEWECSTCGYVFTSNEHDPEETD